MTYEREWTPGEQDRAEWLAARAQAPATAYDYGPNEDYDPDTQPAPKASPA